MKNIIFISLIIIALSKESEIEFNKEILFNKSYNNEFELKFPVEGSLYISIKFNVSNILNLNFIFRNQKIYQKINSPGVGIIMPFEKNYPYKLQLEYKSPSNESGIIWMNPSTNEINANLNQTYEWKFDFRVKQLSVAANFGAARKPLVYSIDNAEKDVLLEFQYNKKMFIIGDVKPDNPLKVCHGNNCEENITSYLMRKGESYKIYIEPLLYIPPSGILDTICYMPSFSFSFNDKVEKLDPDENHSFFTKNVIIISIILGVLLLGGIVLAIVLICRKKKNKIESDASNNIKFEDEEED